MNTAAIRDARNVLEPLPGFCAQLVIDPVVGHFFADLDPAHRRRKIEALGRSVLFGERS